MRTTTAFVLLALGAWTNLAPAPASAQASTSYLARVRSGLGHAASGDSNGAARDLREAIAENPSLPSAHCFLAEVQRTQGDFLGAVDTFQSCLRFAREANDRRFVGRALHGIASTLERTEQLSDARTAWQEYVRFADGATDVADARIGRARIEAIDVWTTLEQQMTEVRARIAERERAH